MRGKRQPDDNEHDCGGEKKHFGILSDRLELARDNFVRSETQQHNAEDGESGRVEQTRGAVDAEQEEGIKREQREAQRES